MNKENLSGLPQMAADMHKELSGLCREAGEIRLMEVCGTHTMEIAHTGLKSMLPEGIVMLSGPGCPVCVTPVGEIDAILALSMEKQVCIATYGDMLRVPGSVPGDNLLRRRAQGAKVQVVYSPMDAVEYAERNPLVQVVFVGIGFETTAPATAVAVLEAAEKGLQNFSVLCLLKRMEPALRSLMAGRDVRVHGFLCPGHVAAITGAQEFAFIPKEYGLPAVVGGFTAQELIEAILRLARLCAAKKPALENAYPRLVQAQGNPAALHVMAQVFTYNTVSWRGLGEIAQSGFTLAPEYRNYNVMQRFAITAKAVPEPPGCRCGSVIRGAASPLSCPLFGRACTPTNPVGPCMVSGEGACAAAYRYRE